MPATDPTATLDRAWRNRRRISDHLTRRWTGEYLKILRTWNTSPRGRPVRLPRVGEVVLVHGETKRTQWPLARVVSLIPGRDGHPRAATIRLKGRITRRPINKLYRLEASPDGDEDNATATSQDPPPSPPAVRTRAGRHVRPPQRLGVYVKSMQISGGEYVGCNHLSCN